MDKGKALEELSKEELIEKVKKAREYYQKMTETIAERDKQIEKLTTVIRAVHDLIPGQEKAEE